MAFSVANSTREMACACTPLLFRETTRRADVGAICASIADCLEAVKRGDLSREEFKTKKNALKNRLPAFYFHALFREEKQEGKATNHTNDNVLRLSGLSIFDIDDLPDPRAYWEMKSEELRTKNVLRFIALAHVTPSGEGLRLVFVMPEGEDLEGAQRWMAAQLEVEAYDKAVKDYARASFAVPEEYILYINEEQLFSSSEELKELEGVKGVIASSKELKELKGVKGVIADTLLNTNQKVLALTPSNSSNFSNSSKDNSSKDNSSKDNSLTPNFKGIPYADIIAEYFKQEGEPAEGERNTKLSKLAWHLRTIADYDEGLLLQIMPRYGLAEGEMRSIIHSACSSKRFISKKIEEICRSLSMTMNNENKKNALPPALPKKLPKLMKAILAPIPEMYRPVVASGVFPALAVHLRSVQTRYVDNVLHEFTFYHLVMAGTGAGKDCLSQPIDCILEEVYKQDEAARKTYDEWREKASTIASNQAKPPRPRVPLVNIFSDITNASLMQMAANAEAAGGLRLYTKVNEVDEFARLRGFSQLVRVGFDPDNRIGQNRVRSDSVDVSTTLRWNWNAATTLVRGHRFFDAYVGDGTIERIMLAYLPEQPIASPRPRYGDFDEAYRARLRPYIERLRAAEGIVKCPPAVRMMNEIDDRINRIAQEENDLPYWEFSKRERLMAYKMAVLLYIAHDYRWDHTIAEFVWWRLQYGLWCKTALFGNEFRQEMLDGKQTPGRGVKSSLDDLPDSFTFDEVLKLPANEGKDTKKVRDVVNHWVAHGKVVRCSDDRINPDYYKFVKTASNNGNDINPKSKA